MRAVVDTNVWFNAALGVKEDLRVFRALVMGYFVSVTTEQVQREMWAVEGRDPKLSKIIGIAIAISEDVSNIPPRVETYIPPVNYKDIKIVDTALRGGASLIITNDSDFWVPKVASRLKSWDISVVTPAEFLVQI